MGTITAVILRILSNPLGNFFQKRLSMRGCHPFLINSAVFFLLGLVCVFPALSVNWRSFPQEFWGYSVLVGIFGAVGNAALVKALQSGELSVLGPMNAWKSIVGMIFAFFLLREIPTAAGLAGIGLIVLGSDLLFDVSEKKFSFWLLADESGIALRLLAMILAAVEAVFIKKVILFSDPTTALCVWCWFGSFFSALSVLILKIDLKKQAAGIGLRDARDGLLLVLCIGTMQWMTNEVFARLDIGVSLALFQLSAGVSILLGWRFFRERRPRRKLAAAAVMIAGSALILLYG